MKFAKLGSCCIKIGSGATPKGGASVYVESGVALIRSQNVYNLAFSYNGLTHITDNAAKKLAAVTVASGDVLLNITGDSVARVCMVPDDTLPARVNQHVAIIRTNKDLSPMYLMYYLASPYMQSYMLNLASGKGASRNALTKGMIEEFLLPLPSIEEQLKISSILFAYDDLIVNNNRRIKILEKIAENLYKEMFSYRHIKIKAEVTRLGSILQIIRGISYSSEEINVEQGLNLINLKNIEPYGGFRRDGTKKYDGKYKLQQVVSSGDLVMGVTDMTQDRRTVGSVAIVPNLESVSVISADLIKITSTVDNLFLYAMFKYGKVSRYIAQFANGANVLHLKPQDILKIKVLIPKQETIRKYVALVSPMFHEMEKLSQMNMNLTKQRDLLLPRLMSGKLEV